ncbi:MAG: hypothetical protein A2139_02920 [Desulfobacca sp. RBG_16_60_12]|nr:MAG: hypothetical protein A2139_02920 [Desulfobacca sp. RBG_16_60_12]
MAWFDKRPRPFLFGVEAGWFRNDPMGCKILRDCLPDNKPVWELVEHECYWGVPFKMSTSCPVPPPRAVCSHGYIAAV